MSNPIPHGAPIIRELSPEEAGVVRTVMQTSFAQYTTADFSYGTERETDESIRAELEGSGRALAVFQDGEPVAVVKLHPEVDTDLLYFWRLAVLPTHRGQGHADRLMAHLAVIADELGLEGFACNVVPRQRELVPFYERHGMELVGEVDFTPPDGEPMTLLRLERRRADRPRREVRELGPADADLLREVMHAAFAEYEGRTSPSGVMLETAASLRAELEGPVRAVAILDGGRPVAAMKLTVSRAGALEMSRIAVIPEARGRGLARELVDWAVADARRQGLRAIGCTVRADETGNIALYEHLGLTVTAHGVHQSLTGRSHRVVQMRRPVG